MSSHTRTSEQARDAHQRAHRGDPRTVWRMTLAIALPIGPLAILAVRALLPYWTDQSPQAAIEAMLAAPATMDTIAWIGVVGVPGMIVTVLGLGFVARRGAPVLASLGAVIGFLAFALWTIGGSGELLVGTLSRNGYSLPEIVSLSQAAQEEPLAVFGGSFWVVGHIVGLTLLGAALWRARIVAWWVALLLMVSQPMHLVAAIIVPSKLLDVTLGWGLTAFSCVLISVAIARMGNDEWDLPALRREGSGVR